MPPEYLSFANRSQVLGRRIKLAPPIKNCLAHNTSAANRTRHPLNQHQFPDGKLRHERGSNGIIRTSGPDPFADFRFFTPTARIGYSLFIFNLTTDDIAGMPVDDTHRMIACGVAVSRALRCQPLAEATIASRIMAYFSGRRAFVLVIAVTTIATVRTLKLDE